MKYKRFKDMETHEVKISNSTPAKRIRMKSLMYTEASGIFHKSFAGLKHFMIEPDEHYDCSPKEYTNFFYILAGTSVFKCETQEIKVNREDIICINPGEPFSIRNVCSEPFEALSFYFCFDERQNNVGHNK